MIKIVSTVIGVLIVILFFITAYALSKFIVNSLWNLICNLFRKNIKMNKIQFCKNCKYHYNGTLGGYDAKGFYHAFHLCIKNARIVRESKEYVEGNLSKVFRDIEACHRKNTDGKCFAYKRKWWKAWAVK